MASPPPNHHKVLPAIDEPLSPKSSPSNLTSPSPPSPAVPPSSAVYVLGAMLSYAGTHRISFLNLEESMLTTPPFYKTSLLVIIKCVQLLMTHRVSTKLGPLGVGGEMVMQVNNHQAKAINLSQFQVGLASHVGF